VTAAFRPEIPPHVATIIRHLPPDVKRSIKASLRALSTTPNPGEPLLRELHGLWKYRVRRFRIVYGIDHRGRTLRIMAVGHRKRVYEDLAEMIRTQRG